MARRTFIDTANAARLLPTIPDLKLGGASYITRTITGATTIPAEHGATYDLSGSGLVDFTGDLGTQVAVVVAGDSVLLAGESTPEGTYVLHHTSLGWQVWPVGGGVALEPDTTAPTAGTLTFSAKATELTVTVTGAMDDRALASQPYRYSRDGGTTWTAWQTDPTYTFTGLTMDTPYSLRHEVRDRSGNSRTGALVSARTTVAQVWTVAAYDDFTAPDGTQVSGRTVPTGTGTWTEYQGKTVGTITDNAVLWNQHAAGPDIILNPFSGTPWTKGARVTANITTGSNVSGGNGGGRLLFSTNSAGTNSMGISYNRTTLGFYDYANAGLSMTPATVPWSGSGEITFEWMPTQNTGRLLLNGTEVATLTATARKDVYAGRNIVGNGLVSVDDFKVEVSNL